MEGGGRKKKKVSQIFIKWKVLEKLNTELLSHSGFAWDAAKPNRTRSDNFFGTPFKPVQIVTSIVKQHLSP